MCITPSLLNIIVALLAEKVIMTKVGSLILSVSTKDAQSHNHFVKHLLTNVQVLCRDVSGREYSNRKFIS